MSLIQEFKTFALKGSMVDLAIGVVIGAAFGKVVSSLVSEVIMPPLGLLIGGIDFSHFQITLKETPPIAIKYGAFINALIDFFIISLAIFFVIKGMNRLKREKPTDPTTKQCPECLSEIPIKASRCKYCTCEVIKSFAKIPDNH